MMRAYFGPLLWLAENYLKYNPFFIYGGKNPLLHQTEIVAKVLFLKPTRILIADVIGLGKTISALRILKTISNYKAINRILIAVPSVLIDQWIDEMKSMGITPQKIEKATLDFLSRHKELPSGWYIGSIDTLKRDEYFRLLLRNKWDGIIVDEAHKLGIPGNYPNMRWKRLGKLIRVNKDSILILLSATPHRGKPNDYLSRLALIDPSLLKVTNVNSLEKVFDTPEYYLRTHNIIVFRRNKEDINRIYEQREIFKPCNMLAILVEPSDEERKLLRIITELATGYLSNYYRWIMEEFNWKTSKVQSLIALLRAVIIKRSLSSPQALLKTFSKLIERRGKFVELLECGYSPDRALEEITKHIEKYGRELDEILTGDIGESEIELDEKFDELATYFDKFLDEGAIKRLSEATEYAKKILQESLKDSKLETLKRILSLVLEASPEDLPDEFRELASGKVIVFTEFKDTAYYIYDRIKKWVERRFSSEDVVRIFTSDNRNEIEDIKKWLSEEGKKILITTNVAGEGLNLQHANVIVNYEITWSPIRLEQRIGRVWRYGQRKTTYVFNLFLADALEKEVAEVVFAKLYGITISLGKLEPILGEKVFLSTIRNELLEHVTDDGKGIRGLIPIELEIKGQKYSLSEIRIIDLIARDARAFVNAFIKALRKLTNEIRKKMVYPFSVDAEKVRRDLRFLTGFGDNKDAMNAVKGIIEIISRLLGGELEEQGETILLKLPDKKVINLVIDHPEISLNTLIQTFSGLKDYAKYFVFQDEKKILLLLTLVTINVGSETRYREPIGILADFEKKEIIFLRGKSLIETLASVLVKSIPVDEIYGLDNILSNVDLIMDQAYNIIFDKELKEGVMQITEAVRNYEKIKRDLKGYPFFDTSEPRPEINEPKFILISSAFLPEIQNLQSDKVWDWIEDEAVAVVLDYEKRNGREATDVSAHEHFDVLSVKRDPNGHVIEERFIEIKAKTKKRITIRFTGEESRTAKEKKDSYWLYIVYGVATKKPVILAIRDPIHRLPFKKKIAVSMREEYVFSPSLGDSG